ncbi:MAG: hypothetical protein WBK28_01740 [Minisyncoccia bacterium]
MKRYVVLTKEVGQTPLQAIHAWKAENPEYASLPAAYAGRLDPMASGTLLVLLGEECKRQEHYRGFDKEYEIEVLLDVGSDTGDALGVVAYEGKETEVTDAALRAALRAQLGTHLRAYPAYSSKTVNGKPLFLHALEGALPHMVLPEHEETIYRISHRKTTAIDTRALGARVDAFLLRVPKTDEPSKALGADFRIDAVRASWDQMFREVGVRRFMIITLTVACGSGTYMRTLAPRLGTALGSTALALSIRRTKIGRRFFGLWFKTL